MASPAFLFLHSDYFPRGRTPEMRNTLSGMPSLMASTRDKQAAGPFVAPAEETSELRGIHSAEADGGLGVEIVLTVCRPV